MDSDVVTVPVNLDDPELKAALAADLPIEEKGALVRDALTKMGATLLDLRDAQRGLTRRRMSPTRRAEYEAANAQAQADAARLHGTA
jgi:hypothetical protein